MGHCVICLRKVREDGDNDDGKGVEKFSVLGDSQKFSRTFNEFWTILKAKGYQNNSGNSSETGGVAGGGGISLTTAINSVGQGATIYFSVAPTLCQLCGGKVVAVENLMKAVRQQVREVEMLLVQSRKKGGLRLNEFEMYLRENGMVENDFQSTLQFVHISGQCQDQDQPIEDKADADVMQVKEADSSLSWDGQLPVPEDLQENSKKSFPSQLTAAVKSDPVDTEAAMECDNEAFSLEADDDDDDAEQGAIEDEAVEEDEEEEEDDSNWAWEDDDPDYIKSEEDDNANDDYEYDEEYSSEDEEAVTMEDKLNVVTTTTPGKDPLEIPSTSGSSNANQANSSDNMSISCDVKVCGRKFKSMSGLRKHRKSCHPTPAQQLRNLEQLKKDQLAKSSSSLSSSSSLKVFSCDLEACSRKLGSKESLSIHQKQCHLKLMIELGRIKDDPSKNKFPCSCGRSFPSHTARYCHQSKSKTIHPEFQYKFRELRSQMENGQMCDFCDEPVKLVNILQHLTNHLEGSAEYVVKCPNFDYCGHMFTHSKKLHEGHLKSQRFRKTCRKVSLEKKIDLSCETCGFTTDKRIRLPTHVANEHERGTLPKNIKCPISGCDKIFAVRQSIYFHLHAHRYKRITTQNCKHCLETIKIEEVDEHFKDKHGFEEVIGCKQCPLKFSERDEYVAHLWIHRHIGLSCDICDDRVKFLRYCDFRDHYFGEHQLCPKTYKCGDCENKWFWRKGELIRHRAEEHNEMAIKGKKKRVSCNLCFDEVSFSSDILLISHKIRVHGAEPFTCDICGETFHEKVKFNKHKKEHAGMEFQNEWRCEVEGCGRSFKSKYTWKRHQKMGHVGDGKPYYMVLMRLKWTGFPPY